MAAPKQSLERKYDDARSTFDEIWEAAQSLQQENNEWHKAARELGVDSPLELALFANNHNS